MTLDEAIRHAEEVAETCEYDASKWDMTDAYEQSVACELGKCVEEHRQLAEWLKELKTLRQYIVTELEISCASSNDIFDENDERYYVLDKLNSMIAVADRYPNNLRKGVSE